MIEKQSLFVFTFFTLLILNSLSIIEAATVIGIDYGTDWFKVSIVKPGIPLNIVLNRDSKRKTQSVITIRDDERLYGADAVNIGARVPSNTYFSLKRLLGRVVDDKYVQEYKSNFPNKIIKDPIRGTVLFQHNETTTFSVEELVAMQLSHAKKQAEVTAQEEVKDSVITVPPYYNQFERQAILDAAEIAGLRVLSLINDLTAVGINYAITHSSSITEDPQIHLFYDMGAGSTKASVIKFNIVNNKDAGPFNKTFINLEVLSTGYDRTLGGQEFDLRLRKYFATKFDNLHSNKLKESIFKSDRAMTKLFKEANRVKQILSANTETIASVIGGGIRVPAVQNMLKGLIGEDKIAQNLNGDEAAVLGAGFRGAGLSHHFKVKEVKVTDITSYPTEFANQSEKNINENDISVDVDNVDIKPLGEKEKLNSIQRLLAMERIDNERHARERAMNYLESYVYKYQDFLDEPIVIQVTTVEQRSELSKKLSETSDWLYGEGENAPTDEFHLRLDTLRLLEKPISFRQEEFIKRPDAISSLELLIDNTRGFIEQIRTNITVETWHYTDADIDKLLNVCDKIENWLKEKLAEQGKTALYIDPIFTTDDIQKKVNEIKREFLKLVNKKPPIKAKSSTTTTATTESVKTNDTTADSITQETSNVTIPSDTETTTEAIEPKTTHQEL
ncbi:4479_t:CDS:2 [Entrophospora sp. SA101]|nr:4479_t:CDS:2 [Entrophospora sp. SA101]